MKNIETLRHSAAHILAQAIKELYPKAKLGIGPAIENGFYYDFDNLEIKAEEFEKIEKKMKEIIKRNLKFIKKEISAEEAKKLFKDEPYKLELIKDLLKEKQKISVYWTGDNMGAGSSSRAKNDNMSEQNIDNIIREQKLKNKNFVDLCSGPHVKYTKEIKHFKLLKIAGAYWKGDEKNKMLTRIYGTAFEKAEELKHHLHTLEEIEKRSHRKLGKKLDLFSVQEETGPGLPLFHPKGTIIFNLLRDYWEEMHKKAGYVLVNTPHVYKLGVWKQSGHWEHYKENMFLTKYNEEEFGVKPMNCPGHLYIYNYSSKSYRDLPIRMGEMGVVYRCELSGTLSGLFRVIKITQDDAHIFCRKDQVEEELKQVIDLTFEMYKTFGFKDVHTELSTRPEKSMGSDEVWKLAESTLEKVLKDKKIKYKINPGDGAFYGPKIDFHIKDVMGRSWQCGTLQLDFSMPERFNLEYTGEDNKKHRPVMLHRVVYGSLERFIGILIENYGGAFPVWLAPVQVKVISFTDDFIDYSKEIESKLAEASIRVEGDYKPETVQKKVRDAELEKVPFILVCGQKEKNAGTVAVRTRGEKKIKFGVKLDKFIKDLKKLIESKENKP